MSKFNQTNTIKTTNKSGHIAYAMPDKAKLVTQVLTSMYGEAKFYGDTTNEMIKTANAVLEAEPKFVANLARYARKEMHLRSVSHALTALVAHNVKSKPFIKEVVADVVERADDITEILACYLSMFGKPIPNGLKKALATAIGRFNAYQIAKYNGGNKEIKFKDVLKLTHAKPITAEQSELFKAIINDTLPIAERWETELSAHGNNKETWEKLIDENKIGYMAMLRNLRNIVNANPSNIEKVFAKLFDKNEVLKSKQLPFRFFSAYREIANVSNAGSRVFDTLETAIEHSIENMPKLHGKTIIAIDTSGSMTHPISSRSSIACADIAKLLAVMGAKICDDVIVYNFDTKIEKLHYTNRGGIISTTMAIETMGGGTNISLPLQKMLSDNIHADRLIILSDNEINQSWNGSNYGSFWGYGYTAKPCQPLADEYRRKLNKDFWVHAIDLQGYGTQQFVGAKTNIIAGWSEKLLEFINLAEQGINTQIKAIEEYGNEN